MATQFIDVSSTVKEEKRRTTLTHHFNGNKGWEDALNKAEYFEKLLYLGKCRDNGDLFCGFKGEYLYIYKGIKGDEFNQ